MHADRAAVAPLHRTLFQLSYPLFLSALVTLAVLVIDTMIWSAHSPETAAVLSLAAPVLRIAFELSTLLGIGSVILIAQYLGGGNEAAARRVAEAAVMANAVFGLVIGAGLGLAGPMVIGLMAVPDDMTRDAAVYLRLAGLTMGFHGFANAALAALRGFGRSRSVCVLGVFGGVLYLALEYVLVLGAGPVPALGSQGAGFANLILRAVVVAVLAVVLTRGLRLHLRLRQAWRERALVWRLFGLSLPSVSDYIAYGFYQLILLGLISTHGTVAVLSRAYVMIAMSFLTLVIMAVCQGTEVLIGYSRGRGDRDGAYAQGIRSTLIAMLLATGCAVAFYALSGPFINLFTRDTAVHTLARQLLWLTIFLQPCFALNVILFHALRAVEDVRWPVAVSQMLTWGMALPLAWLLCSRLGYGIEGVWYAFIAEELAKGMAMLWRWQTRCVAGVRAQG